MAEAAFRAGGLVSGLDSNSIIDQFTSIEARPLNQLRSKQSAYRTQISTLGDVSSRLKGLKDAAQKLQDNGVVGAKVSSTNTGFSASPGSAAMAGQYSVDVTSLATAARAKSDAFGTSETLKEGSMSISVDGTAYEIAMHEGEALSDLVQRMKDQGVPINAVVLNNGTSNYLSLTRRETGSKVGEAANYALQVTESYTGATGKEVNLSGNLTNAKNAVVTVNDITFTRTNNLIADAVPGTTLTLKALTTATETLSIENDVDASSAKLKTFVDAYNSSIKVIQAQLSPSSGTDRSSSLAGDAAVRSLQGELQRLLSTNNGSTSNVRSLADLGVKTNRDGSLTIESDKLKSALARDSEAVNQVFAKATAGLGDMTEALVNRYTSSVDGILTMRSKGLNENVKTMDRQAGNLQIRIDGYRNNLIQQFTSMEKILSGLKSTGNFIASNL